jgi:hypothetical protein
LYHPLSQSVNDFMKIVKTCNVQVKCKSKFQREGGRAEVSLARKSSFYFA